MQNNSKLCVQKAKQSAGKKGNKNKKVTKTNLPDRHSVPGSGGEWSSPASPGSQRFEKFTVDLEGEAPVSNGEPSLSNGGLEKWWSKNPVGFLLLRFGAPSFT